MPSARLDRRLMIPLAAILVIDDDPDVLAAAQLALLGHVDRIDVADTPEAIDRRVADTAYECVLLDLNFAAGKRSGAEGMAALARIHALDPALAVVVMTAYGAVALAVASLKQGAEDFLLKPWKNDALIAAVRAAAVRTRALRAPTTLDALERAALAETLRRHKGNVAQTARSLGLSRPALYRRMARHGLRA